MQELIFLFQQFSIEYIKQYQLSQFVYSIASLFGAITCIYTLIKSIKYAIKVENNDYHFFTDYYMSIVFAILSFFGFLFCTIGIVYYFVNFLAPLPGILHF